MLTNYGNRKYSVSADIAFFKTKPIILGNSGSLRQSLRAVELHKV